MRRHSHVILEGPDGAGKTYLARQLCYHREMRYHHEGPPPKGVSPLHHYAKLLTFATEPTVFDRFHLGEVVYPPLLGRGPGLTRLEQKLMARLIIATGTRLVVCLPPWETCWAANKSKPEMIRDETTLYQAYAAWRSLEIDTRIAHEVYDHTMQPHFILYGDKLPTLPNGAVGSINARVLFVGEQPNSQDLDLPFFGTEKSSGYLNARLEDAGLAEESFALTNARWLDGGARDLQPVVTALPKLERVVPLGNVADLEVRRQNLPFVTVTKPVPHPQYWRRFHASETHEYTRMILRAVKGELDA